MLDDLDKYCIKQMDAYGGAYTIDPELEVVAVYKMGIQDLEVISFEAALKELRDIELEEY